MVKVGRDFTQNIRRKYDGETFEGVKRLFAYYYYYAFFLGGGVGAPRSCLAVKARVE